MNAANAGLNPAVHPKYADVVQMRERGVASAEIWIGVPLSAPHLRVCATRESFVAKRHSFNLESIAQQAEHPALTREVARSGLARFTKRKPGSSSRGAPLLQSGGWRCKSAPGDQTWNPYLVRLPYQGLPTGSTFSGPGSRSPGWRTMLPIAECVPNEIVWLTPTSEISSEGRAYD